MNDAVLYGVVDGVATLTLNRPGPRIVGVQRAKELMLSAREISADGAKTLGIVCERVPQDDVLRRAGLVRRRRTVQDRGGALSRQATGPLPVPTGD
ncbi:MAG TPA: enoyl-CoA hydratase-related protein [Burkholderiaceae bacterium]|nr:enoyl-CoA hydratase-related protein [Burkholderiaceae bacterium]